MKLIYTTYVLKSGYGNYWGTSNCSISKLKVQKLLLEQLGIIAKKWGNLEFYSLFVWDVVIQSKIKSMD